MRLGAVRHAVSPSGRWLVTSYLLIAAAMNLVWEVAQLPAYTLWQTAKGGDLVDAVIHCTAGDVVIDAVALFVALLAVGGDGWPGRHYVRVATLATTLQASYTIFSEWLNVEVLRSWAYAPAMILVPPFGTGLTPLLQSIAIPPAAFFAARRVNAGSSAAPREPNEQYRSRASLQKARRGVLRLRR